MSLQELQFLERLTYTELTSQKVDKIGRAWRALDWTCPKMSLLAVQALSKPWKVKCTAIGALAGLIAYLSHYRVSIVLFQVFLSFFVNVGSSSY